MSPRCKFARGGGGDKKKRGEPNAAAVMHQAPEAATFRRRHRAATTDSTRDLRERRRWSPCKRANTGSVRLSKGTRVIRSVLPSQEKLGPRSTPTTYSSYSSKGYKCTGTSAKFPILHETMTVCTQPMSTSKHPFSWQNCEPILPFSGFLATN